MPVMDEFREEREAIKNSSFKEKIKYFLDYYKWYVLGGIAIVLFAIVLIKDITTSKDYAFFAAFINSYSTEEEKSTFMNNFSELAALDLENYNVTLDTSMVITDSYSENSVASSQMLMTYTAAGDLDILVADETTFTQYATADNFYDLTTILSEEQLTKYEPLFYYVDMAEIRRAEAAYADGDVTFESKAYDHRKPEEMEDPVAIGIYIDQCEKIKDKFFFTEDAVPLGILLNTKHLETSLQFIDYVFE